MARSCKQRVEVLSARSETTQVFANQDGTSTMEISAVPRWVKRSDGSWVDVDATLRANTDGSLSPVAATLDVRFSGGGSGPMATIGRGGQRVSLTWPDPLPKPSVAGDTATYADVFPGVDLLLRATASGFSHVFVVRSAEAAANPELRRIGYRLSGGRVTLRANGQGGVDAVAADGTELWHSGGATMWDSSEAPATPDGTGGRGDVSSASSAGDHARQAQANTWFDGERLLIEPDLGLLKGPATRFPLYIDPAYFAPGFSRWAYATSTNVNRNDGWARVGREPEGENYLARSFFEFPTTSGSQTLAGARIISATFSIVLWHSSSCGATPVSLWHSGGISTTPRTAWSPALLDGSALDTQWAAANKGSCYTSATPTVTFGGNLTANLQGNTGGSSYTLALASLDECDCQAARDQWKKFHPGTATLTVQYNHAPTTPSPADLSMHPPGVDPVACGSIRVNATNGITLRAKLYDSDGDNVKAQWTVNGIAPEHAPPDSALAASGSEFTTDLPATALPEGSYSWTVRGNDGTDAGGNGPTCSFIVDNTLPRAPTASSSELALTHGLIVPTPPATAAVGRAAAVTLTPASGDADIAGYLIGIGAGAAREPSVWVPAGGNGSVVAPVVPIASGSTVNYLKVQARDMTGMLSGAVTYKFKANAGTVTRVRGDATGDGRADVTTLADASGGRSALWRWDTTPGGSGSRAPVAPQDHPGTYPTGTTTVLQGDVDGDGLSDVATFQPKGTGSALTVQRSDGNALLGTTELWSDATWAPSRMKAVADDFTGDGKADLMVAKDEGSSTWKFWVFAAAGSPGSVQFAAPVVWWANPPGYADWNRMKLIAGDLTGDGKADVGNFYDYGSCHTRLWVHHSTGSAFGEGAVQWDGGPNNVCWDRARFIAGDVTGDGKDDWGHIYDYGSCQVKLWIHPANAAGTGFDGHRLEFDSGQYSWCAGAVEPSVGDLNADGKADLSVVYRCCGPRQFTLWRFLSNGTSMAAPALMWRGTLGADGFSTVSVDASAVYKLVARHSGLCLDVGNNSVANGATLWQWGCHGYSNQAFRLVPTGAAHYMLQPAHTSAMCISAGSSPTNGTRAFQYQCGPSVGAAPFGDQAYKVEYVLGSGDETLVRLLPVHSDKCLDVSGVSMDQGAVVHQWDCYGGANQDFYLRRSALTPYNLMGSYPMNESGGTTLADRSGRNATATLYGGAGAGGGYGSFNGTSAYAATSGPAVDTSQSFTVSAWVRLTDGSGYRTAVSQDGQNVGGFNLGYQPPQDGNVWALELRNFDGYESGAKSRASAPATLNTWTHLVGVRDAGANQLRLYVNGQLAGTAAYTHRWNATGSLAIGRVKWFGHADFWPGDIDDVRVWNRALGADEIATLHATRT
jgi:hypothetical protein